jgi:hypothetical protein
MYDRNLADGIAINSWSYPVELDFRLSLGFIID